MSTDQWASALKLIKNPTVVKSSPKTTTSAIAPSSFHKKKRAEHKETTTERHLNELLERAHKNEVVQKRKDFSSLQNKQLKAYESVTSFRIFPLQSLAIEFLDEMMKNYLGSQSDHTADKDSNVTTSVIQSAPTDVYKRRKVNDDCCILKMDDKLTAVYIKEMKYNPFCSHDLAKAFQFLPPLWSMEPRIFAMETSSSGKRKYVVSNLGRFLHHYWKKSDPLNRHYYELIRENTPCRLYFDLEFCKVSNKHITDEESEVLMSEFIDELCIQFLETFNISLTRPSIVDLDSSTEKKFSRHLIVHLPNDKLFSNAQSAGLFAKQFVSKLADEMAAGSLEERRTALARNLFVKTNDPTKTTCFVDLGVYTRNRLFRLMGSSKFGKPSSAALRIARANEFQFPQGFCNSSFYVPRFAQSSVSTSQNISNHDEFCESLQWGKHATALAQTLVVPANVSKRQYPILKSCARDDDLAASEDRAALRPNLSSSSIIANRQATTSMTSSGQSPIPKLDEYILSTLGRRGGPQGRIRAWSIECIDDTYYVTYQMCENRFCERIGRQHRSNNIMWTVNLKLKICWQSCHDSECRGFRGNLIKLHNISEDVVDEINEFLFDRELEQLDVDGEDEFNDSEIERALGDIDLPVIVSTNMRTYG